MTQTIARLETGVRNLDELLEGGLPHGSVTIIAGPPGAGKTVLAQQICFHNASADRRALYFSTLSEPTAKTLRYLSQFSFFSASKLDHDIQFIDLGVILRTQGLASSADLVMGHVRDTKPAIVVIDSFRVFDDLSASREDLRKFGYELAVNLMAWEVTSFLIGEFGPLDVATKPLFSIVDGMVTLHQREQSGEQQRYVQIVKMRGTNHSRDAHSFTISHNGIEVFAPRVSIQREELAERPLRLATGVSKLDDLLGEGIPRGSSLLVAGVAGTGKSVLSLEFIYRGAQRGEKGIVFSFEETAERLRASARGLGWDLEAEIERGMVEVVFIPQPNIMVEAHLLMMRQRIEAIGAQRVVIDSLSVFLHKIKDPQLAREKTFQLCSIVQNAQAVGFFVTDIPYGSTQISRFGVEETVVDGVLLLTSLEEGLERRRYLEIYKLRNTAHLKGRHSLTIGSGGIAVYPRYDMEAAFAGPSASLEPARHLPSGVPGLDALLGGGPLERSVTLVAGSAGIGKSTLALQFIAEGAKRGEPGLYLTLEEAPEQIIKAAEALGLTLRDAIASGLVEVVHIAREGVRPSQLLSFLTDKIRAQGTRRLALDGVDHLSAEGITRSVLRRQLFALVSRFKTLGVTTVLTLESASMYSTENITAERFSPVADNLIVLRYLPLPGERKPTVSVVKTRGSAHDFGTYFFNIECGGVRIGPRADATGVPAPADARDDERHERPGS
jgi:circadian clock protein KaiC